MNVTYLFREQRPGNFSIEELFGNISDEVAKQYPVYKYYCKSSNRLSNLMDVGSLKSDIYHITGDVNYLSFNLPTKQTVITVHDLGHFEKTLKGYKKALYKQLWLNLPFKSVSKITTISEFTKSRLIEHCNVPESKISVIHNPAPLHIFKRLDQVFNAHSPKILQIGSGHNKNINNLIDAVKGLDIELMLVRKPDAVLKEKLQAAGIKHKFYPLLSYEEVYQKYVECDLVYFASNYEGFGMPILEAQAVGRAIITSTVASMPEIGGKGAHYVDYQSVSEIKDAIIKLANDVSYRERIVNDGFTNVEQFSLGNIIPKYIKVYKDML